MVKMSSQSIENKILSVINRKKHGSILFASDFADMGERKTINKVFERIALSGKIIRLARGIYCKPKIDTEFGFGIMYPSVDDVAQAIAQRDKCRIVPTGDAALNKLGLSTQVPMNAVYLTDGTPRRIKIYNGRGILFKHVVPKRLDFKSELIMLITFALQRLGQGNVSEEQLDRVKHLLANEPKGRIVEDLKLIPGWIRSIILKAYE
ncbi:DUF6088 family protein [Phocaeicola dorei]|uniref:DUF6088 family protein n=2 Tax=Phocaeicola dorei TaxID=357276 RepID=UPI00319DB3C4